MSSYSTETAVEGRRVIVVCGASGTQGGSVARHLLYQQEFAVKILTRNPDSEAIQQLESLGAEVVVADFEEPETLLQAFQGAYGVFGVTKHDEKPERCTIQGKAMVNAAKATGVQHFIWSTFPAIADGSMFMDPKARVNDYLRSSSVPYTLFYPAVFYPSLFSQISQGSGHWKAFYFLPLDTVLPMISPHDIGAWVSHAFSNPGEWRGRCMKPCTELLTMRQYSKALEDFSGLPVHMNDPTMEDFLAFEKVIPEIWRGLKWYLEEGSTFFDQKLGRKIYPTSQAWVDYLDERLNGAPEPIPVVVKMNVDVHVD